MAIPGALNDREHRKFRDVNGNVVVAVSNTDGTDIGATPSIFEGAPVTVGTTAVEATFSGTTKSISLQSDHDNTGKIWWGKSNVDNTGANALGRLAPGQAVEIGLDDSSAAVYVVSDTATQTVYKAALT